MSDPLDLTSLDNVRAYLALTGTGDDALLERMITAHSRAMQQWMNRTIPSASYVEKRNGRCEKVITLANYPVTAVTSVVVDGVSIPVQPAALQPGYVFSDLQIMLVGYTFTRGFQNVMINYTAGYASTPPELGQACIEWIALRYRERSRIGQTAATIGGNETASYFIGDMPASVKTVMSNWKKVISL